MQDIPDLKPVTNKINGFTRFGENGAATAGDTVWPGNLVSQGAKAINSGTWSIYLSSTNAGDTGIEVTVVYLDASGVEKTVTGDLNGQAFVDLGVTASFVNRAWISEAGATLSGNVLVSSSNTGASGIPTDTEKIEAILPSGDAQTMQLIHKIPLDKDGAVVDGWDISIIGNTNNVNVKAKLKRLPPGGSWRTMDSVGALAVGEAIPGLLEYGRFVDAGTILMVEVETASQAVDIAGHIYLRYL